MSLKKILVSNTSCHDFSCICWASPLLGHRFGNGQLSSNCMQRSVVVKNPFLQHVRWDDAVCLSEKYSPKTRMPTSPFAFTHIPTGCCHPQNQQTPPIRSACIGNTSRHMLPKIAPQSSILTDNVKEPYLFSFMMRSGHLEPGRQNKRSSINIQRLPTVLPRK